VIQYRHFSDKARGADNLIATQCIDACYLRKEIQGQIKVQRASQNDDFFEICLILARRWSKMTKFFLKIAKFHINNHFKPT